jgi:hypothetical protein
MRIICGYIAVHSRMRINYLHGIVIWTDVTVGDGGALHRCTGIL